MSTVLPKFRLNFRKSVSEGKKKDYVAAEGRSQEQRTFPKTLLPDTLFWIYHFESGFTLLKLRQEVQCICIQIDIQYCIYSIIIESKVSLGVCKC